MTEFYPKMFACSQYLLIFLNRFDFGKNKICGLI